MNINIAWQTRKPLHFKHTFQLHLFITFEPLKLYHVGSFLIIYFASKAANYTHHTQNKNTPVWGVAMPVSRAQQSWNISCMESWTKVSKIPH